MSLGPNAVNSHWWNLAFFSRWADPALASACSVLFFDLSPCLCLSLWPSLHLTRKIKSNQQFCLSGAWAGQMFRRRCEVADVYTGPGQESSIGRWWRPQGHEASSLLARSFTRDAYSFWKGGLVSPLVGTAENNHSGLKKRLWRVTIIAPLKLLFVSLEAFTQNRSESPRHSDWPFRVDLK